MGGRHPATPPEDACNDVNDDSIQPRDPGPPAILFADVAGSTRLYELFGDQAAKKLIDACLRCMREAAVDSRGRVVKIIGDEIMCVFPDAEHAYLAATEMQIRVGELSSQPVPDSQVQPGAHSRAIRVGFHAGAVIEENGDLFGDTVNVASRMTEIAKANQIINQSLTREYLQHESNLVLQKFAEKGGASTVVIPANMQTAPLINIGGK